MGSLRHPKPFLARRGIPMHDACRHSNRLARYVTLGERAEPGWDDMSPETAKPRKFCDSMAYGYRRLSKRPDDAKTHIPPSSTRIPPGPHGGCRHCSREEEGTAARYAL